MLRRANGSVALSWTNPTPISGSTVLEAYTACSFCASRIRPWRLPLSLPTEPPIASAARSAGNNDVVVFVSTSKRDHIYR